MEQGAEPIVLVPGLASDARVFAPQIIAISRQRAVHVARITAEATVEAMADAVLADAPGRFALAGHSLGAIVAMEVQRRAPERISRIALLATDCLSDTPKISSWREELIVAARAGRLGEAMRQALPPEALAPGPARPELMHEIVGMAMGLGPEVFIRQMRALQKRADQQRTLRALRIPTLILGGRHDTLCPVRRQEFMETLSHGARLEILEEAGHLPTLEAPQETTRLLSDWLDRQAPLILRRALA